MTDRLLHKALAGEWLTLEEGIMLWHEAPLSDLIFAANERRKAMVPGNKVGWIIDRNVNITNVCISGCKFCNFHCKLNDGQEYITSIDAYHEKIDDLFEKGGDQLLLQGGMHPQLGLSYYQDLFRQLKAYQPALKLHALGPPEIVHITRKERMGYVDVLTALIEAGLDSLPGAGAEILSNRVRKSISPGKCTTEEWLEVMRQAHKLNLVTSATMMYGHIETIDERIGHLLLLREVQYEKPDGTYGFVTFVPWPYMDNGTQLATEGVSNTSTKSDYVRLVALSRLMLPNITNIQASWLTMGKETAQVCLHAGANDMGSIMLEEHVVSAAGASHLMDAAGIQKTIVEAGFTPVRRNQTYEEI